MKKHWRYLTYVARHKWFVFRAACKMGVPWLGLIHDLSKFRPDEWFPYVEKFYGGPHTPRAKISVYEKTYHWELAHRYCAEAVQDAFDAAWLKHQHRNAHHPQHWRLVNDTDGVTLLEMPERYVREMVADWVGAGMAIKGHSMAAAPIETLTWWRANQAKTGYAMHPETAALVERLLAKLRG